VEHQYITTFEDLWKCIGAICELQYTYRNHGEGSGYLTAEEMAKRTREYGLNPSSVEQRINLTMRGRLGISFDGVDASPIFRFNSPLIYANGVWTGKYEGEPETIREVEQLIAAKLYVVEKPYADMDFL
jgi:hypothetical protein